MYANRAGRICICSYRGNNHVGAWLELLVLVPVAATAISSRNGSQLPEGLFIRRFLFRLPIRARGRLTLAFTLNEVAV